MPGANLDYLILRSLAHSRSLATQDRPGTLYSREAVAKSVQDPGGPGLFCPHRLPRFRAVPPEVFSFANG